MAVLLFSACQSAQDSNSGNNSAANESAPASSDQTAKTAEYHKISAEEAKKMMDEQDVVIVDVRTAAEYAEGHIADAVLVPNETIGDEAPAELPNKDAVLLIYCRSGNRSRTAANKLLKLGYQNIYDFGGINTWPYEIVK
ncbi:rhodanese-like domain-containing protein [Lachnospiraceae bacterium oral taxon 500]|nr:rhodanese-like domain-containing protein [Lachnospiraceae bacterium oral taxon 500]